MNDLDVFRRNVERLAAAEPTIRDLARNLLSAQSRIAASAADVARAFRRLGAAMCSIQAKAVEEFIERTRR